MKKKSTNRPHYHAIIFGYRPHDLISHTSTLFTSKFLSSVWPHGFSSVGDVSFASAQYVASYTLKRVYGDEGYPVGIEPPFLRASQSLGRAWVRQHTESLVNDQIFVAPGRVVPVPKKILELLEVMNPKIAAAVRSLRARRAEDSAKGIRPSDLSREIVASQRSNFERDFDEV